MIRMFNQNNSAIKSMMKKYHVREYQVASYLGRSYGNFISKLREPLTSSQRKKITRAIKTISKKDSDK